MGNVSKFLKGNKAPKENATYAATKSLTDDNGEPLLWEIKPVTTKENERMREDCTTEVQVPGKSGLYRQKLDTSKYIGKLLCASIVEPNLYDAELQDSYGVKTPEDLLMEMVDDPGEYAEFAKFIQGFNGFTSFDDEVNEAKNG